MKVYDSYLVCTTNEGINEVASTHLDFIDAMQAAEKLIKIHPEVNVVFSSKTICKTWKNGHEQVTRGL